MYVFMCIYIYIYTYIHISAPRQVPQAQGAPGRQTLGSSPGLPLLFLFLLSLLLLNNNNIIIISSSSGSGSSGSSSSSSSITRQVPRRGLPGGRPSAARPELYNII